MSPHPPVITVLHGADAPPDLAPVRPLVAEVRAAGGPAELAELLPGTDVLFVWDFNSDALAESWPRADRLRWVHTASAGVDRMMFPALVDSDVLLTNSRGVFDQPMAEYVLGLLLAFAKDLPSTLRFQGERRWRHRETRRLAGSHAVVVGTGPIGRAIGRSLTSAGVAVTGVGRTGRDSDPDLGQVHPSSELATLLPDADHLVLAAPLTKATRGLVGARELAALGPEGVLVNVGRGPLVDQRALEEAVAAGTIGGAALDVFEEEPLPEDSPLWSAPSVIVSPHMSGDVVGWRDELVELFGDNLRRVLGGREPLNVVDKRLGYVSTS
ncbi:D-2-hydroxyacid dehydrogenase [Actinoalloteichus sp. AHMU CJ021]|uniref:Phosphoglycerate dehydrogenase n=1 Tax=Actinoalloteichus caeruleus DSM 43889 TaxID=1120930 RepID=A0ABT1JBT8_ACTCY|nr:D-2-hydroxyacid dehydrogenase [Actinoalloteichus caeruleus]AUS80593.1 D-2-hydroxyacid dehydrogenase [Actinoalloteichus sp. AHMU CJ021]MCP2329972.1 Phosphoglycerate dehydrogenase [Actinoalloteichus caeruleus DSM 43889]